MEKPLSVLSLRQGSNFTTAQTARAWLPPYLPYCLKMLTISMLINHVAALSGCLHGLPINPIDSLTMSNKNYKNTYFFFADIWIWILITISDNETDPIVNSPSVAKPSIASVKTRYKLSWLVASTLKEMFALVPLQLAWLNPRQNLPCPKTI